MFLVSSKRGSWDVLCTDVGNEYHAQSDRGAVAKLVLLYSGLCLYTSAIVVLWLTEVIS